MARKGRFTIVNESCSHFETLIKHGLLMTTHVSDHQYDLGVRGEGQIYLKSVCMDYSANPSGSVCLRILVFDTAIAWGVSVTIKLLNSRY